MDLGTRLRQLRVDQGMTQTELATPRYTAAYVSTIEAGKRRPSAAAMEHFASKLGVSAEQLSTGRSPDEKSKLLGEYAETRRLLASTSSKDLVKVEKRLKRLHHDAQSSGYPEIAAKAAFGLAFAAELKGELDRALTSYAELEKDLATSSPLERIDAVVGRARVLQAKGDTTYAAFILEKAVTELEVSGLTEPSGLMRLHSSLVAAYFGLGLMPQAIESAQLASDLARDVTDNERLANMNLNVAIVLMKEQHWTEAEKHFEEATRLFEELDYRSDLAKVRYMRGLSFRDQGNLEAARAEIRIATEVFQQTGQPLNEARAVGVLAITERLAGNIEEARFLLRRSINLSSGDLSTEGIAYRELALCETDRSKALGHLRQAIKLLEGAGHARELAATYRELGNLLSGDETLLAACEAYRKAADLFEQAA